ncbi:MAG: esterase/lipase family protein [Pseudonocardiaceae bacterium]
MRALVFNTVGRELISLMTAATRLSEVLTHHALGVTRAPFTGVAQMTPIATPVLLLHGYLGTDVPWTPLVRRLHTEGFINVFTLRYDSVSTGVPQLAAELADHVATILARAHHPAVHLVGHSLGGLVARYAVQRLGLDRVTRSVTTVATPHRGSPLAWLGPGPAAAQLRPDSVLLRELPPLEATRQVRWAVIHAGADFVVPAPRAGDGLCLAGYGHHSILGSPELAAVVVAHLMSAEPTAVDHAPEEPAAPPLAG